MHIDHKGIGFNRCKRPLVGPCRGKMPLKKEEALFIRLKHA